MDRITDGVAVILVEKDGETAEEVHVEEEHLPVDVDAGDKVLLVDESQNQDDVVKDLLVVALGTVSLFVGSIVLMSASPSIQAGPFISLPSEHVSVAVNSLFGLVLMAVGVRVGLPSLDSLINMGKIDSDTEGWKKPEIQLEKLSDTEEAKKRTEEKTERLRSKRRESSEFKTDGGE